MLVISLTIGVVLSILRIGIQDGNLDFYPPKLLTLDDVRRAQSREHVGDTSSLSQPEPGSHHFYPFIFICDMLNDLSMNSYKVDHGLYSLFDTRT